MRLNHLSCVVDTHQMHVQELACRNTSLTATAFQHIAALQHLRVLRLEYGHFPSEAEEVVMTGLNNVRVLGLAYSSECRIVAQYEAFRRALLQYLAPQLEELTVTSPSADRNDTRLAAPIHFPELHTLRIESTIFTMFAVRPYGRGPVSRTVFPQLQHLHLFLPSITGRHFSRLTQSTMWACCALARAVLPSLASLHLDNFSAADISGLDLPNICARVSIGTLHITRPAPSVLAVLHLAKRVILYVDSGAILAVVPYEGHGRISCPLLEEIEWNSESEGNTEFLARINAPQLCKVVVGHADDE